MARPLRLESEDGVHHGLNRGNYRADLFRAESKRHAWRHISPILRVLSNSPIKFPVSNLFHRGFVDCDSYANGKSAMARVQCPVLFLLARIFHSHDRKIHRNIRLPCGQSDLVAVSPDKVGPTGRTFHTLGCKMFELGRSDAMAPPKAAQSLQAKARDGRTVVVEAGHQMKTEAPDAVLFALKDFPQS